MNQLDEVVKYVLYQCRAKNNPITETLASFIVQTILNRRKNKFFLEEKLNESELNELKQLSLDRLSNQYTPQMKTIQLQISYDSAYIESEINRQDRVKQMSMETGKLIDEVVTLEIKNAKDFEGLTVLYKKIFNFLLYKNRELIENPNPSGKEETSIQFNIDKEVAAALESVIPRAALGPFVSLNPSEKVTQLVELSNLVIGIRLFNKKIGKGGVSLSSLNDLVDHFGRILLDKIRQEAIETIELCDAYTIYFQNIQQFDGDIKQSEMLKDELTFLRQYLSYILSLQEDVELSENQIESNQQRYNKEIEDLKHLLENKSSAPKEQVYPKFATLAQSHTQLFEEKKLATQRMALYQLLLDIRKNFQISLPQNIIRQTKSIQSQQIQPPENLQAINYSPESGVQRMLPQNTPDFMQTPLDYLGFCVWSIVNKDGLLLPGKPSLGVYRYKERNCVFANEISVNEFLSDPNKHINGVIDQCRKNPQLIHLLRMEDAFKSLTLGIQLQEGQKLSNKLMVDKSLETPLHFVEKNLDPNYCWNEWELRRKAIQMANIRKRQTKASQTILSNFKVDSEAQVYEKRDKETNTGLNKGHNPLRPRNYITNLRDKNNK